MIRVTTFRAGIRIYKGAGRWVESALNKTFYSEFEADNFGRSYCAGRSDVQFLGVFEDSAYLTSAEYKKLFID